MDRSVVLALTNVLAVTSIVAFLHVILDLRGSGAPDVAFGVGSDLVLGASCAGLLLLIRRNVPTPNVTLVVVLGFFALLISHTLAHESRSPMVINLSLLGLAVAPLAPATFGLSASILVLLGFGLVASGQEPSGQAAGQLFGLGTAFVISVALFAGSRRRRLEIMQLEVANRRAQRDLRESYEAASAEAEARRVAEAERLRVAQQYKLLADHSLDVIFTLDSDGRVTYMSPSIERLIGQPPEASLCKTIPTSSLTPESMTRMQTAFAQAVAGEFDDTVIDFEFVHRDGTIVHCETTAVVLRSEDGAFEGIQASMRDVTPRVEALAALRESEARYRMISENAGDLVYVYDGEGRLTYVSPSIERVLGYQPEERIGLGLDDYAISPESRERARAMFELAHRGELEEAVFEVEHLAKDGRCIWTEQHGRTVRSADGSVEAVHVTARDITAQRAAREQLRESESRYRLISENAADVIYVYDMTGTITWVSPSIQKLLGFSPAERIGKSMRETAMVDESMEHAVELLARATRGEIEEAFWEMRSLCKDGGSVWTEVHATVMKNDAGEPSAIHAAVRDITDRRRAERALRDSEERYRLLAERSLDPILGFDADGLINYASRGAEKHWGVPVESLIGLDYRFALAPESRESAEAFFQSLREGTENSGTLEITHLLADGRRLTSELSGWIQRDEAGNFEGFQCAARDVTERKQALATLERQRGRLAERATQLAALNAQLDAFSGTVSHDLQGPLRRIRKSLERLDQAAPDSEFETLLREVSQMSGLVDHLLALARDQDRPLERTEIEVHELIRGCVAARRKEDDRPCRLIMPEGEFHIRADRRLLESIVSNLVDNAFKYVPRERTLELRFEVARRGDEFTCSMTDNGDGFATDDPSGLFEWFRRGAEARTVKGYGIGLATVRRIVERHGGRVWADNAPGGGAAVHIVFRLENGG